MAPTDGPSRPGDDVLERLATDILLPGVATGIGGNLPFGTAR
jgi:hypothetical protein